MNLFNYLSNKVGEDCTKIILNYKEQLEHVDKFKSSLNKIKKMETIYLHLNYDDYKITKIDNKYYIQFITVLDNEICLLKDYYIEVDHFRFKKTFNICYNIKKIWNAEKVRLFHSLGLTNTSKDNIYNLFQTIKSEDIFRLGIDNFNYLSDLEFHDYFRYI